MTRTSNPPAFAETTWRRRRGRTPLKHAVCYLWLALVAYLVYRLISWKLI